MLNYELKTPFELDVENPLKEYPRPYFKRNSYLNLNGHWNYTVNTDNKNIPSHFDDIILVPYPIESELSKVRLNLFEDEYLWYYKKVKLEKNFIKDKVILHFNAVNQICDVYINKKHVHKNCGGYLPFHVDVTEYIDSNLEFEIILCVENKPNLDYGVGKAGKKRGGMWYTKTTGIWQTVWMESYSKNAITDLKIKTNINGDVSLDLTSENPNYKITIKLEDKVIYNTTSSNDNQINFKINSPKLWDIDNPYLYEIKISNNYDEISSYLSFREFTIKDNYFYLNNKPIFINGLLDQGYFSDGIFTPSNYEAYKYDILKMKELGFNTLRKHIKLEPQMFYYYCDKYGMLVLQDFINSGKYSFLRDTAIPTIGFQKLNDTNKRVSNSRRDNFINESKGIIDLLYPHPSVVYYTIFNEGWGQFNSDEMYDLFKKMDSTRIFDSTSGWFRRKNSDVESIHVYFKKVKLPKNVNRPIILSEFGGYSLKVEGHLFNTDNNYGYKLFKTKEDLTNGLVELYERDVINLIKDGLAGAIYTQVSDVEDETNGLLTYDRKIVKIDEEIIKNLMKKVII